MYKLSVCLLAALILGLVNGEGCTTVADCAHTSCDNESTLQCDAQNGICVCVLNSSQCSSRQECLDTQDWWCPDRLRHCYDGKCVCQYIPA